MSQCLLMTALFFGGLTLAAPRAVAQGNLGPFSKTQSVANVSCQEMQLDSYERCDVVAQDDRQTPSFDLWCLEIQLYPSLRCEARGSDDVQAYEHYRSLAEQLDQQRGAQQERDQELMNLLNRDPLNHDQMDVVPHLGDSK